MVHITYETFRQETLVASKNFIVQYKILVEENFGKFGKLILIHQNIVQLLAN